MQENEKINYLAHTTKLLLDLSHMEERRKEYTKLGVDVLAEILKLEVNSRKSGIVRIQEAARTYNLDCVVAFPCVVHGEPQVLLKNVRRHNTIFLPTLKNSYAFGEWCPVESDLHI